MKRVIVCTALMAIGFTTLHAQSANSPEVKKKDSIIMADIVNPAVNTARQANETPNWALLTASVTGKYDATYADRTITKARIYYYYGKDWPAFSTAIVHYTQAYEDKEDLKLMNKNAKMILQYSTNPDELKTAATWVKHAVDKEPSNTAYQETYQALAAKIK
jgi:hypothetical protein